MKIQNKKQPVCDREGHSGQNRIAIIWPEPEPNRHPTKLALGHSVSLKFAILILKLYNEYFRKPQK